MLTFTSGCGCVQSNSPRFVFLQTTTVTAELHLGSCYNLLLYVASEQIKECPNMQLYTCLVTVLCSVVLQS